MMLKTMDVNRFLESSLFKIVLDEDGNILDMTEAVKLLMQQNYIPQHISEIFDSDLQGKIEARLADSHIEQVTGHNILSGYLDLADRNREPCYIIYQHQHGKAIITIKIGEQNEKLDQLYENAFKTANLPMALINECGFIISTNNLFMKEFLTQSSGEFMHVQDFLKQMIPAAPFSYKEYILEARTQNFTQRKMSYESKSNGILCYCNVYLQLDHQTEMFILKIIDITEQEQLLEQLLHSDQLSTTGEIAASIAHEVRNPMTTLQGFLQLLEHEVTGNAHMYVTVIQEEVKRMNDILNEMLSLSKPIVDEITIFSLSVLVEDVLLLLRPKALLDHINLVKEIHVVEPVLIQANPNRMKQVLVNLLKNAMEAMEPQGTLSVLVSESDMDNVNIFISDTGTGMTEDMVETIFQPFVSGKEGGTGLGLPFVKKTVLEYGGSISVTSEIDKGSTFQLTFPRVFMM